jgi:hypothetical protein
MCRYAKVLGYALGERVTGVEKGDSCVAFLGVVVGAMTTRDSYPDWLLFPVGVPPVSCTPLEGCDEQCLASQRGGPGGLILRLRRPGAVCTEVLFVGNYVGRHENLEVWRCER